MKFIINKLLLICSLVQNYLHNVKGNDSVCCSSLEVSTTGTSNSSQFSRFGAYHRQDTFSDRPTFKHESRDEYMFYMPGRSRGLWMIGPQIGKFSGGLANRGDEVCPENLRRSWKFANGRGWVVDSKVNITCINSESDCFYADEKFLDGGGENDVKIVAVSSTVDCIDKCIEHNNECLYWSVSKNQDNNDRLTCHLRRWKGRLTERKGYISGSLPSACFKTGDRARDIQSPESSENDISNNNVATTPNCK
jgi:hypothetical protein